MPIRVVLVEDSLTVRKRLAEILEGDSDFQLVGEAEDGKTGLALCERVRPDVIALDMMLPVMTGLTVTEYVMAHFPTPILIVSASKNRGELFRTYDALAAGALEVLEKPRGHEIEDEWDRKFLKTLKLISRIKVITHPRAKLSWTPRPVHGDQEPKRLPESDSFSVVAMGASTGGPAAIRDVLRTLPADFPLPILLVLHIGDGFGAALAEWLDGVSPLRVAFARDGEPLPPVGRGRVILAPADTHLIVSERTLRLRRTAERNFCRPSVDVLFESVAADIGNRAIACLLTGMGRDGAAGLLAIRNAGGACLAQDEATSVVYGMPREAAVLGAARWVLPLPELGRTIVQLAFAGPVGGP